jgi:hypothetical protein
MTNTQLAAVRDAEEEVRGPGLFQGEASYVPWMWARHLDGEGYYSDEGQYGEYVTLDVTEEDVAMFPELDGRGTVTLYENNEGFICEL